MEGRINTMLDLIPQLAINTELLTEESKKIYDDILAKFHAEEK